MYTHNQDKDNFERKAQELRDLARTLGTRHLQFLHADFYAQSEEIIAEINHEIITHCLSYAGGASALQEEIQRLSEQDVLLIGNHAKLYMIVKKEKRDKLVQIVLHQVGFVGAGAQFAAGVSVCVASAGLACAGFAVPMITHGSNNIYENGYYLLMREDTSGKVRDGYRYVANQLGFSNGQADFVYGAVDLGMTGYGATRKILLPRHKTWKLWDRMYNDTIYGWQEMSKVAITTDAASSGYTGWSLYRIAQGDQ